MAYNGMSRDGLVSGIKVKPNINIALITDRLAIGFGHSSGPLRVSELESFLRLPFQPSQEQKTAGPPR